MGEFIYITCSRCQGRLRADSARVDNVVLCPCGQSNRLGTPDVSSKPKKQNGARKPRRKEEAETPNPHLVLGVAGISGTVVVFFCLIGICGFFGLRSDPTNKTTEPITKTTIATPAPPPFNPPADLNPQVAAIPPAKAAPPALIIPPGLFKPQWQIDAENQQRRQEEQIREERDSLVKRYAGETCEQILDYYDGQEGGFTVLSWKYISLTNELDINMQVDFRGAIIRNNYYELKGNLIVHQDGRHPRFRRTYENAQLVQLDRDRRALNTLGLIISELNRKKNK